MADGPDVRIVVPTPTPRIDPANDALALLRRGETGEAVDLLREALVGKPDDVSARRLLAGALMRLGRHGEAASEFTTLIECSAQPEDYYFRGLCLQEAGKRTTAGADFAEAARLAPSNPIYSNKNLLYLASTNKRDEVAGRISEEIRLGVRSMMANWVVAAALLAFQDGQETEARQLLDEAGRIFGPKELSTLTRDPAFEPFLGAVHPE